MIPKGKSIADYGLIGDLHTAALVGLDGSIDWYCYPHFDSPSVFGALLDAQKGGRYQIRALDDALQKQVYYPDTNVLLTRFLGKEGVGEVTDFMPIRAADERARQHRIVRRVAAVRGRVDFRLDCRPAFDYARAPHATTLGEAGARFESASATLALSSPIPLERAGAGVEASFSLREGESVTFSLQGASPGAGCDPRALGPAEEEAALQETIEYWHKWLSQSNYRGRWREMVHRSALALKLLTFRPTGAIVAAVTTSIPETPGGERNWDYRYTWIRDAAFTLYGLLRIGFTQEARDFMEWLQQRAIHPVPRGPLQPIYRIDGSPETPETTLDHLAGYADSRPVRIGNAAAEQFQLDIYGALVDAVYLYNKYGTPIGYDLWTHLRDMLDWLCDNWSRPDSGIWEVRSGPQPFVHSRVMCWVALDRGLRLAAKRSFPADVERWRKARDAIYEETMRDGWSEEMQSFVQSHGSDNLDASALLMPLVFFMSPTDPRMLKTLDAIGAKLASDNLVHRYDTRETRDGLTGPEGTFSLCTFWYVEALTRAGRLQEARVIFEKMLGYTNHLGLYSEEIGPRGEALGNFPQAFTHLTLISAAFNLDRRLGKGL